MVSRGVGGQIQVKNKNYLFFGRWNLGMFIRPKKSNQQSKSENNMAVNHTSASLESHQLISMENALNNPKG